MRTWYGSLQNRLEERMNAPEELYIGMGATELMYTDRRPYEIIAIKDDRHVTVRELDAKRIDKNGMGECQEYEYTSNPNNVTAELFKTKEGRWVERIGRKYGSTFRIGVAEKYYDYSF